MSSPLARLRPDPPSTETDAAVFPVDDDDTDAVLDALSSETARNLFSSLHEEPAPPSVLARRTDTSVQNAHYHLSNLESAGVVKVVGTRYSEKGNEMDVYGPAADPIVLTGDASPAAQGELRGLLADWAAGVATIGLVGLALQLALERVVGSDAPGFFEPASTGSSKLTATAVFAEVVAAPGLLFFVGGVAVLTVALALNYRR
jgi:DNA-binding transcriptional ArsR family regulator